MASNIFEDLSGVSTPTSGNPYDSLLVAVNNDPAKLQSRYDAHRNTRNVQQKAKILSPAFSGWTLDPYLAKLDGPQRDPNYVDPRNCLVFWARPPKQVRQLIGTIQQALRDVAPRQSLPSSGNNVGVSDLHPDLWLMPLNRLHMTTLEVAHSLTAAEIEKLLDTIRSSIPDITDYPINHRARIIKPMVSYDSAALALSFVPAAGESLRGGRSLDNDEYTYHHLRRDVFDMCHEAGVDIGSRYTVPSAHLTIARFISHEDCSKKNQANGLAAPDPQRLKEWIEKIEEINAWLKAEYWPREGTNIKSGGEWIVGEEKGLDCCKGRLWYGGGESVRLGKGFETPN